MKDTYLLKGQMSMRFERGRDNIEKLLAEGWHVYDPLEPGGEDCTNTHRTHMGPPCRHGRTWWCPQAPKENWHPNAKHQQDRHLNARLRSVTAQ